MTIRRAIEHDSKRYATRLEALYNPTRSAIQRDSWCYRTQLAVPWKTTSGPALAGPLVFISSVLRYILLIPPLRRLWV